MKKCINTTIDADRWYNDIEKVDEYVHNVAQFHHFIKERHAAYYDRREHLDCMVVFGRFYFDHCGNTLRFTQDDINDYLKDVPRVMSVSQFNEIVEWFKKIKWFAMAKKEPWLDSFGGPFGSIDIPNGDHCSVCKRVWTLENIHDCNHVYIKDKEEHHYYHRACHRIFNTQETKLRFESCLRESGWLAFNTIPITNEYFQDSDGGWCSDWFIFRTPYGDLKIGPRKRVIHLDYSNLKINLKFEGENVTKETGKYIHAWTLDLLKEYLLTIYKEVSNK